MTLPSSQGQLIVAHRGASAVAPENTLAAFRLAWSMDADAIEGDFHLTLDDQIVCHHDFDTERTGGKKLVLAESTLAELRTLEYGAWKAETYRGERIATLAEVLTSVPTGRKLYIEVKCGPEIVPALEKVFAQTKALAESIRVIAFDKEVVRRVKQALPKQKAYWLAAFKKSSASHAWTPSTEEIIQTAQEITADGVGLQAVEEVVDADFVRACREASLSVHVWTVDDPTAARAFRQAGVDSITTNRPDQIREALSHSASE